MRDLFHQNYPKENFEILLLNDHSEDGSMAVAEETLKLSAFSKCTFIHPALAGKKAAITEGVKHAMGKIIVTIDADCRVGPEWLASIDRNFSHDAVKMVFGAVKIEPTKTIFQSMQAIEFASLIGTGAATMAYGIPTMSNGANLAFRKLAFEEVDGYEGNLEIASGDDEFLMRKIAAKYQDGIRFNNDQQGIVVTNPQSSVGDFFYQRIRWAGKWSAHTDVKTKLLAVFIFIFHAAILVTPVIATFNDNVWVAVGFILLVKAYLEYRFLRIVNFWLNVSWSWPAFILLQATYSFYAVSVGIATLFVKPVWKGRKNKTVSLLPLSAK
jgi:cellulose synthase/poly-beta-1,6-N-acetylglucosamine synthase-like glycosyltransferase